MAANGSQREPNEAKLTDVGWRRGKWRTLLVRIWKDVADWTEDSIWFELLIIKKKKVRRLWERLIKVF